jgi:ATPase subunit of ABC transporter with duplicated ATPase domains
MTRYCSNLKSQSGQETQQTAAMNTIPMSSTMEQQETGLIIPCFVQDETNIPTVLEKFFGPAFVAANLIRGKKRAAAPPRTLHVLSECRGVFRPGTVSLLLAPPGHGKSTLLRAVAGHIPATELKGTLMYNGVPAAELPGKGVRLNLLATYVDQARCRPSPELTRSLREQKGSFISHCLRRFATRIRCFTSSPRLSSL